MGGFRGFIISVFLLGCLVQAAAQNAVHFVPNRNQWSSDIHVMAKIPGGRMALKPGGFSYLFTDRDHLRPGHHSIDRSRPDGLASGEHTVLQHLVEVRFSGSNPNSLPVVSDETEMYYNFFVGDASRHAAGVHGYEEVRYERFYEGIDLVLRSEGRNVKYDFVVSENADPSVIRFRYDGVESLLLKDGNLEASTPLAAITEMKPVAFQCIGGMEVDVPISFALIGNEVSFVFPEGYDRCEELVIDPLLIFSTYSGSEADNWGSTATPGEGGTLYSAGVTIDGFLQFFPATPGAYQISSGGFFDIGILKYDSTGRNLLYATYLGGTQAEFAHSLLVNNDDELLVLGTTSSDNYPTTTGAFDQTFNGGNPTFVIDVGYPNGSDIILSRLSADGKALLSSTFLGGTGNDGLNINFGPLTRNYGDEMRGDIIVNGANDIFVSSVTSSEDFPHPAGAEPFRGGATDGLIIRMPQDLSQIAWSSYIGGAGVDAAYSIKVNANSDIFIAGGTTSSDFPVTAGTFQTSLKGDADGWIAQVASDGSGIIRATFTGTSAYDQVYFTDLGSDGTVYVYGQTTGNFPVTSGVYKNQNGGQFVQGFNPQLSQLEFSTVFGAGRGVPDISPTAFLVNDCNNLYMTGWGGGVNWSRGYWPQTSNTTGMAITPDAFQSSTSGNDFYFIVMTDNAEELLYATYMGGTTSYTHVDGGTSRFDKLGVVYHAVCAGCNTDFQGPKSDFPTTPGAWSRANASDNCNNAAFKFDLSSLRARIQTNSRSFDRPGLGFVCLPDGIRFQNLSIGGETYRWDLGDGTKLEKTDSLSFLHHYELPGTYTVKLVAIDRGTCREIDSTQIVVKVFDHAMQVGADAPLCEGSSHQLQASGGVLYSWTASDSVFTSSAPAPVISPRETTSYYIRITDMNGCILHDTVNIDVTPKIDPEFDVSWERSCEGMPVIRFESLTDSLQADDHLVFDLDDGTSVAEPVFTHSYSNGATYQVTLRAERNECVYTRTRAVPAYFLILPNVITPEGDEKNEFLRVQYDDENATRSPMDFGYRTSIVVYNRWGRVVFEDADYENDWRGEGLVPGVYYYEIDVEKHASCRSWLHIIR